MFIERTFIRLSPLADERIPSLPTELLALILAFLEPMDAPRTARVLRLVSARWNDMSELSLPFPLLAIEPRPFERSADFSDLAQIALPVAFSSLVVSYRDYGSVSKHPIPYGVFRIAQTLHLAVQTK
jgi:hypothetical protein